MLNRLVATCAVLVLAGCASGHAADGSASKSSQKGFKRALSAGYSAASAKDFSGAYKHFSKAISLDSSSPLGYEGRGTAEYSLGKQFYAGMRIDFQKAARLQPQRAKKHRALDFFNVGLADLLSGHLYASTQEERKAIALEPSMIGAYMAAGSAYLYLGSRKGGAVSPYLNEAVVMDRKAIALAPTDPRGYVNLGIAYANLRQYASAVDALGRAIIINPTDSVGWFNRGIAYKEWHKPSAAARDFRQALKLTSNPQLRANLRVLIRQTGK